jgi:phytoene synthase
MTSPRSREALVAEARETIARGSQSFALASRLFDRATRERAWLLYAWCRACDDFVDGQTLGHGRVERDAQERLAYITGLTERALAGEPLDEVPFEALRVVAGECAIPHGFVRDHLAGFAADAAGWRPETEADLLLYCYRVAGAVGCMMAVLMGVAPEDRDTLDRASDLGVAFQLANIARDVREDAENGRCYLPADWLAQCGIPADRLMDERYRPQLAFLAARLAALAANYEGSARSGAARLPFRARWAVLAAASIYGGIARETVRRGPDAWERRVVIRKRSKLLRVGTALGRACAAAPERPREGLWTRP